MEHMPDEQAIANPYPQHTRMLGGKVKREINYFHIRNLINFNFHFDHVSAFWFLFVLYLRYAIYILHQFEDERETEDEQ